jgi:hypothetical protein
VGGRGGGGVTVRRSKESRFLALASVPQSPLGGFFPNWPLVLPKYRERAAIMKGAAGGGDDVGEAGDGRARRWRRGAARGCPASRQRTQIATLAHFLRAQPNACNTMKSKVPRVRTHARALGTHAHSGP